MRVPQIWYLGASFALSLISLALGSSPAYCALQLGIFLALFAIGMNPGRAPRLIIIILIFAFLKNFVFSQYVKVLLLQPSDEGLAEPIMTTLALLVAALSALIATFGWRLLSNVDFGGFARDPRREDLSTLGYCLGVAGIVARLVVAVGLWSSVLPAYIGELTLFGVIAFVVDRRIKSEGRRIFDRRSIGLLALYALIGLLMGGRAEVLKAAIFPAVFYIYYRARPPVAGIAVIATVFAITSAVLYPLINYSRMIAGSGGTIAAMSEAASEIAYNDGWYRIKNFTERQEAKYTHRMYYGAPMGFINRFTPSQVDNLVSAGSRRGLDGGYAARSLKAVLPQSLGAQRGVGAGQIELENLQNNRNIAEVNNTNYGLVGVFFAIGGLQSVAFGFAACVLALSAWYLLFFGTRESIWAYGFFPIFMLYIPDGNLTSFAIRLVHGGLIVGLSLIIISKAVSLRGAQSNSRVHRRATTRLAR